MKCVIREYPFCGEKMKENWISYLDWWLLVFHKTFVNVWAFLIQWVSACFWEVFRHHFRKVFRLSDISLEHKNHKINASMLKMFYSSKYKHIIKLANRVFSGHEKLSILGYLLHNRRVYKSCLLFQNLLKFSYGDFLLRGCSYVM